MSNLTTLQNRVQALLERADGRRVAVLGSGVTGKAVAKLLARAGYSVTVVDEREIAKAVCEQFAQHRIDILDQLKPEEATAAVRVAEQDFALAVLSPGIGFESPLGRLFGRVGVPKLSEIDLGIAFLGMPEVAVTGTNGKTTTVTLIHQMLLASGLDSELIGNVGTPFVSLVEPETLRVAIGNIPKREKLLVAEVSSYQLEAAFDFSPHIGVCLNIEDDHLERHGTFDNYLLAKSRIFSAQRAMEDWAILWADDPNFKKIRSFVKGNFLPCGMATPERLRERNGCFIDEAEDRIVFAREGVFEEYSLADWKPLGFHNRLNLAAAIAAARLAGATHDGVAKVIAEFNALPHRIEVVGEINDVLYVNDSKGTNVSAVKVAVDTILSTMKHRKIVLLLGGQAKLGSWEPIREVLGGAVRQVIGFGASGDYIAEQLEVKFDVVANGTPQGKIRSGLWQVPFHRVSTLTDAVQDAAKSSQEGDVVLLSPGCASFDAYSDYAARGEHFRNIVQQLIVTAASRVAPPTTQPESIPGA